MRLHLLGSSAGKPVPRPFCSCRVCRAALEAGGRDIRTRTALQLYPLDTARTEFLRPRYQVDISPDFVHQVIRERIDTSRLEHLLITHPDGDHCHVEYLAIRRTIRSSVDDLPVLHIYGNALVEEVVRRHLPDLEAVRCAFHRVEDGDTFTAGDLTVTAFQAIHRGPRCLHYAVSDGRRQVLFAWDGTWDESVWERLSSWRFDAIGMECTHLGPSEREMTDHLTYAQLIKARDRLRRLGVLREGALFFAMHIGDNGGLTYGEASAAAREDSVLVGYDGMVLDV